MDHWSQGHKDFLPCFLPEAFIVLGFTFKSMIHFEVLFGYVSGMDAISYLHICMSLCPSETM